MIKYILYIILGVIIILFTKNCVNNCTDDSSLRSKQGTEFNATYFHQLLDINDFQFTLQQSSCHDLGLALDLLILVHSGPYHYKQRQMIRHTWGSHKQNAKFGNFRVIFLLGQVQDKQRQGEIVLESFQFKDIVQGSFIDSYRNLTYKHVMAFKWHKYFCEKAKVVLKVDDDVFINTPFIVQSFQTSFWETVQDANKDFIICDPFIAPKIIRNSKSKHYIPPEIFPGENIYPDYCGGYAIFYAQHTALQLYVEAQKLPYLHIDDVFVTGFAREKTGINMTNFNSLKNINLKQLLKDLKEFHDDEMRNFFIGPYQIDPPTMKRLWEAMLGFMKSSEKIK